MVTTVLEKVDAYLKKNKGPHFAAFDADGTLWANDVGENFFQYQIDNCDIPVLETLEDPWQHYLDLKKEHPPTAYMWLALLCQGQPIGEVEKWAADAAKMYPPQLYPQQKQLIEELTKRDIKICVVSASVEWAVTGALKAVGLGHIKALGVKTKVLSRIVSDEPSGHITWREGKEKQFLLQSGAIAPMLSCGNTMGDLHLLEMSVGVKIAVQSQANNKEHRALYDDEQGLLQHAKAKNWLTFPLY